MTFESCGGKTRLLVEIVGRSQLHGILDRVEDLGLELTSVFALGVGITLIVLAFRVRGQRSRGTNRVI